LEIDWVSYELAAFAAQGEYEYSPDLKSEDVVPSSNVKPCFARAVTASPVVPSFEKSLSQSLLHFFLFAISFKSC
jgi:hypothetical protein